MTELLKNLNDDFFLDKTPEDIEEFVQNGLIDKEAIDKRWLGYPPATNAEIEKKEKELGHNLPDSYKKFFLVSNGFRYISPLLDNLRQLEKIDWALNNEEQIDLFERFETIDRDEDYLVYGKCQEPYSFRGEYFKQSLKISDWFDGMCVYLNPFITHSGEWEVLQFATWYPGTRRFRSFEEFLEETHKNNLELMRNKSR